jgi:hypothetical protein
MDNLEHNKRSITQDMIPNLSLGDESSSASPLSILRIKDTEKLFRLERARYWVEIRRMRIYRRCSAARWKRGSEACLSFD